LFVVLRMFVETTSDEQGRTRYAALCTQPKKKLTSLQTSPVVDVLHWQAVLPVPVLVDPSPHATHGG
jgi:hypothetical protein